MANNNKKRYTQTHSERTRNADKNREQEQEQQGAVAVVDGGKVKVKKNRVHENYWILIQPKIAATKWNKKIPIFVTNTHPREQTIKKEEKYTVENPS